MSVTFLEETELCERSLRRLADSRNLEVMKTGSEYRIIGAGICGVELSDDECWDYLAALPQVRSRSGR